MKTFLAPDISYLQQTGPYVFLAGSINMGTAYEWQNMMIACLKSIEKGAVLNPRRHDWDLSWEQSIANPQFCEQVNWELNAMHHADIIVFYFDPSTQSPITLLELGLQAAQSSGRRRKLLVCCEKGFWRKGNVDIVCERYGIETFSNLSSLTERLREVILRA